MACSRKLSKKITFQREVETADGGGGYVKTWVDISPNPTVWSEINNFMNIKNPTGRDRVVHGRVQNELTYKFTIRSRRDITPDMRISYDGSFYNIRTVLLNENNGAYMEVFAEKGVAT